MTNTEPSNVFQIEDDEARADEALMASAVQTEPVAPSAPVPSDSAVVLRSDLPHITIDCFAACDETRRACETFAQDRRLARTEVEILLGGVSLAVERYHDKISPHLLILEIAGTPETILSELDRLAEVCEQRTNVVIIGQVNDIALYRALMERNVADYLLAPISPGALLKAAARLFVDSTAEEKLGRLISVIGAKGGVGSSSVADNLAACIARIEAADTLLLDFDLSFGAADLRLNVDVDHGLDSALRDFSRLDSALLDRLATRCGDRLRLLSAHAVLEAGADPAPGAIARVLEVARSDTPFVVADLPHQWNGWVKDILVHSDEIVVVSDFGLPSMRNATHLIEALVAARPNDTRPRLVMNNKGAHGRAEVSEKDIQAALGVTCDHVFRHDPRPFVDADADGRPVVSTKRGKALRAQFEALARQVTGRQIVQSRQKRWGLGRLFGR